MGLGIIYTRVNIDWHWYVIVVSYLKAAETRLFLDPRFLLLHIKILTIKKNKKMRFKAAINTIDPPSPFFAFCTPKYPPLQT